VDIDAALMTCLKAYAGLTALVTNRIHFDEAPQGTVMPYVVIFDVSKAIDEDHQGEIDVEQPTKQFSAYAATRAEAKSVARQLRAALAVWSTPGLQHARRLSERIVPVVDEDGIIHARFAALEYEITHEKE
jgi:hypothetical protein